MSDLWRPWAETDDETSDSYTESCADSCTDSCTDSCDSPVLMIDACIQTDSEPYELALIAYPYVCRHCPRRFQKKQGLTQHESLHHDAVQPVTLTLHDNPLHNQHQEDSNFPLKQCSVRLERAVESHHLTLMPELHFPLRQCSVRLEKVTVPPTVSDGKLCCKHCSARFCGPAELRSHTLQVHKGFYACDHCLKLFRRKRNLRKHVRVHMDVRCFACTQCTAQFEKRFKWQRHMRIVHAVRTHLWCPFPAEMQVLERGSRV